MRRLSSISRKDLKFIAEDIGSELVPFLKTKVILNGMSAKKRRKLFVLLIENLREDLKGMDTEEQLRFWETLLSKLPPQKQKRFVEVLLRESNAKRSDNKEDNGHDSPDNP